jgi:hypothetical protein
VEIMVSGFLDEVKNIERKNKTIGCMRKNGKD